MYQNVSTTQAIARLMEDQYAHWSWDGAKALIEYLEKLEDSLDKPIEFDTVAIRCDFVEYESVLEGAEDYGFIPHDEDDEDEKKADALKYLEDWTTFIQFEGGVIIRQF